MKLGEKSALALAAAVCAVGPLAARAAPINVVEMTATDIETGLSTGFKQCGYLQLATTPRADESFRRETAYMRSVGMTKEVLSPREVQDLVPLIRTDDIIHGFWTPDEGRAALQTSSCLPDFLSVAERQSMQAIADTAALAGVRDSKRHMDVLSSQALLLMCGAKFCIVKPAHSAAALCCRSVWRKFSPLDFTRLHSRREPSDDQRLFPLLQLHTEPRYVHDECRLSRFQRLTSARAYKT